MEFRAGRDEVPWLSELPSTYISRHMRFTTQPLEEPSKRKHLQAVLSTFDAPNMLMFSSDYPHWDADTPEKIIKYMPKEWHDQVFFGTAAATFRIRERLRADE